MTKATSELCMHDALYKLACRYPTIPGTGVSGLKALAQIMGKSENTLRNKLGTGSDKHFVSFEEASAIMELCAQAGMDDAYSPLHAMNWRHGFVATASEEVDSFSDECIHAATSEAIQYFGNVAGSINESLADQKITPTELEHIEGRFKRFMHKAHNVIARVRGRAARDKVTRPMQFAQPTKLHAVSKQATH